MSLSQEISIENGNSIEKEANKQQIQCNFTCLSQNCENKKLKGLGKRLNSIDTKRTSSIKSKRIIVIPFCM